MSEGTTQLNTSVIAIQGLFKSYGRGGAKTSVLSDLSLHVRPGECTYLAGPSGSGKSTLLSIIGCILSADGGVVRILSEDVDSLTAKQRSRLRLQRIGFVFQRFHLVRGLTAIENVCVPMLLTKQQKVKAHERAMYLLETFGLSDKAFAHPSQLSTGQCQRIALARALANDPELILADEPTASLDAENGQRVMELLLNMTKDRQRTVVVVTHDSRIFRFADRIHWLENGRIVRDCVAKSSNFESTRNSRTLPESGQLSGSSVQAIQSVEMQGSGEPNRRSDSVPAN